VNQPVRYLLDTDLCIYLLNGDERVKAKVAEVGIGALAIASPTVGELYFGAYNSVRVEANVKRVRSFLTPPAPAIVPIDAVAAECFGRFKARLRREGKPIGDMDLFIAGVAASRRLTVVTNNTEHFERITEISLENWLELPEGSSEGEHLPEDSL